MSSDSELRITHVLAYPFPSSGHFISHLDLTKRLVSRGVYVTVLITPSNLPLVQPLLRTHAPYLQHLLLPPPQFPDPKQNRLVAMLTSMHSLHYPIIQSWVRSHPSPPVAIISDFFLGWTYQLGRDLGVPRLVFCPYSTSGLSVFYSLWRDLPQNPDPDNPNSLIPFPKLPNSPVYPWWQITHQYRKNKKGGPEWEFHRQDMLSNIDSWGVVINTCAEVEQVYLDHLKTELGHHRVWAVGPLLLPTDDFDRGGSNPIPCNDVLTWLDSRQEGSVVYVCFGSRTVLTPRQVEVLTDALEGSGVHFILCVRDPDEQHVGQDIGEVSKEFEDRVRGRGLVIRGWAPQLAILGHRSVGAFLTHCGWNSVLEALVAGVVMVAWPMGIDQYTNAKLVVDELGVALRAAEGTENLPEAAEMGGILKRSLQEGISERIRTKELREAALDAIKPGGSSQKELDAWVKQLHELQTLKATP